ncbi:MAG: hypothetical protein U0736_07395 [Gemmataceae bacterium]
MSHRPFHAVTVALVVATVASTQEIRFELGQRLRAMERTLAEHHDRAAARNGRSTRWRTRHADDSSAASCPSGAAARRGTVRPAARLTPRPTPFAGPRQRPTGRRRACSIALLDELKVTTDVLYPVKTGHQIDAACSTPCASAISAAATVTADLTTLPGKPP